MAVRLIHISDLHIGANDFREGMSEHIHSHIKAYAPDVVVVSGDLTHRAQPDQFRRAREFLAAIPFPLFLIPGNHDVPHWNPITRMFSPYERYIEHIGHDLEPVFRAPGIVLAALNTVRSGRFQQGRIDNDQLQSLEVVFGDSDARACRVLVTHHALVGPPGGRIKQPMPNRLYILRRLEELGVNLVLSGHVHEAFCGSSRDFCLAGSRGVVLCQAGLGTDRPRPAWAWETNTYNCVEIDEQQIRVHVYVYDPGAHIFDVTGEHRFPRWYPQEQESDSDRHARTDARQAN